MLGLVAETEEFYCHIHKSLSGYVRKFERYSILGFALETKAIRHAMRDLGISPDKRIDYAKMIHHKRLSQKSHEDFLDKLEDLTKSDKIYGDSAIKELDKTIKLID